jgi:hypothetical protein
MNLDQFSARIINERYPLDCRWRMRSWTGPRGTQRLEHVFVNIPNKVVYLHTHKNASTFVRQFFAHRPNRDPSSPASWLRTWHGSAHVTYYQLQEHCDLKEFGHFWIIRNPVDRTISAFLRGKHLNWLTVEGVNGDFVDVAGERFQRPEPYDLKSEFELFLKRVEMSYFDAHVYPQVVTFADKGINLSDIDDIILFDKMTTELQDYSDKESLGWDVISQKPKNQQSSQEKLILQEYVQNNSDIVSRIHKLYPEDFLIYNHIKELRNGTNT